MIRKRLHSGASVAAYGLYVRSKTAIFLSLFTLPLGERCRVTLDSHPSLSQRKRGFRAVLHCLQENVFQRIALVTEPPNLHLMVRCQSIQVANLSSVLQNDLQSILAGNRAFTSERVNRTREFFKFAPRFEHEKLPVRFAFFLEIAVLNQLSVLENQDLFAAFLNVA